MDTALVGDIGGTNARLALASFEGDAPRIDRVEVFPTRDHPSLEAVIGRFLEALDADRPRAVCIAAAGPVSRGAVEMTNLGWRVSQDALRAAGFGRALVLNDFAAQAYGVDLLGRDDVERLGEAGEAEAGAPVAIVGAGTGFGAAGLVREGGRPVAVPGEGGHIDFAPGDAEERAIAERLAARFGHVSVERLLSGPGLVNIYQALAEIDGRPAELRTAEEVGVAAERGDALAVRTVERFCSVYGATAGDFALIYGARGGVYLAGGLAPHLHDFLQHGRFRTAFEAKGRYESYLRAVPTAIVRDTFLALKGAAVALQHAPETQP